MHLLLAGQLLADDSNGPSGALGLVVFLVLLVGCIFLFRSMAGRINRLPKSFDPPKDSTAEPTDADPPRVQ